jgi:hypothetical protein
LLQAAIGVYPDWLKQRAKDYDANQAVAADYIHRANNLQAIIDGYERLNAKRS